MASEIAAFGCKRIHVGSLVFEALQARVIVQLKKSKTVFNGSRKPRIYIVVIKRAAMASHLRCQRRGNFGGVNQCARLFSSRRSSVARSCPAAPSAMQTP